MTLSVIGAGFGRTGTESMKRAIEILGLGPCHHMKEVIADPEQTRLWRSIAEDNQANWDEAFAGYNAAVDWPSSYFWRELSTYYPDAKIILTVRSPESWYASMRKTIFKSLEETTDRASVGVKLIAERVFGGRLDDRDHAISIYEQNIADVQSAFSSERLLTYTIGDGWESLCRFLGKPVPGAPFPRTNSTEQFNKYITELSRDEQR